MTSQRKKKQKEKKKCPIRQNKYGHIHIEIVGADFTIQSPKLLPKDITKVTEYTMYTLATDKQNYLAIRLCTQN